MPSPPMPRCAPDNKILAALRDSGVPPFSPHLETVSLRQGEALYEAGSEIEHVYFPQTAVLSMLSTMEDGSTVEVGPVGDEGMAGLRVFLGARTEFNRVIVHVGGTAVRVGADALRAELSSGRGALTRLLLRYTRMLLAMTCQSGCCYKLHPLERQLARWLLTMHDYARGCDLRLTHDLIAQTLGVRRAGVTEAAITFREAGLIHYHRAYIRVTDRGGLEARACECYDVIRGEYDSLYADLAGPAQ